MSTLILPAAFALLAWWAGTGLVLYLDGLPRRTFPWTMGASVLLAVAALYGLAASSAETSVAAAYCAFASALMLWATLEISYYLGYLTGVHRRPCPERCTGARRFVLALGTSVYHELAVLGAAGVVHLLTRDGPNAVGLWTFACLLLARWSAKLNLFLGVPNFHREWLPMHLRYMASYVARRSFNPLFPFSVAALAGSLGLATASLAAGAGAFERTGAALVGTLLALALLEHLFLVLPVRDSLLWRWALREGAAARRLDPHEAPQDLHGSGLGVERARTDP